MSMDLEQLLEKFEGVTPSGNGYDCLCPAHDDRGASLSISEGADRHLLYCHAGCAQDDILDAVGLSWRDIVYKAGPNYSEPEATYDYVSEDGVLLFQVVRFPGKVFRQRHLSRDALEPDSEPQWVWNLDNVRRVLYRLPEVLQAIREGRTIYYVEGEKDADRLVAEGKVATCNPGGAGKWRDEYAEMLAGAATVIIVTDRDEPGRAHAETIRGALAGRVRALWVYQAKTGKDVSDHLDAGHDITELVPVRPRVRRGVFTSREFADMALEDLESTAVDIPGYELGILPLTWRRGRMYAVGAYTGDGKTTFGQQMTRKWCSEAAHVTYFTLEMPRSDIKNGFLAHKGIPLYALEEPWRIKQNAEWLRLYREGVEEIASWNLDVVFESGMTAVKVAEIVRDRESDIVFVDHVHRMHWGRERRQFEEEVETLTNIALDLNVMVVLLCQLREPRTFGNKDVEVYPRPNLQSFKESGKIGNDAAMALGVWRQRDGGGIRYMGPTEFILVKNRHITGRHDKTGSSWFLDFDRDHQLLSQQGGGEGGTNEQA